MLLFGHLGITLGTAVLANAAIVRLASASPEGTGNEQVQSGVELKRFHRLWWQAGSWFESLARKVDIRAIFLGSLLPDIIDKPIGHGLLAGSLNNGRIFGHSLILLFIILLVGLILYKRNNNNFMLAVAFGTTMHLVLDSMWVDPRSLFWPFLGFAFEKGAPGNFFIGLLSSVHQPRSYIPEIVGFIIVSAFSLWLAGKKAVLSFLKSGKVKPVVNFTRTKAE